MARSFGKFAMGAMLALPIATFELGKESAVAPVVLPQGGEIVTGSIDRIELPSSNDTDRLIESDNRAANTEPDEDTRFVSIILAQASHSEQQGTSGPRNSTFSGSKKAIDPDLPPAFDENYGTWQKDADAKLKEEREGEKNQEHPLAVANPDSYVVICMAGCRPASDAITYRVSKVAASSAAIATRRLEMASAAAGMDAKAVENNPQSGSVCIAGCYKDEEIAEGNKLKRAAAEEERNALRQATAAPLKRNSPAEIKTVKAVEPSKAAETPRISETPKVAVAISAPLLKIHRISAETHAHAIKKRIQSVRTTQLAKLNWKSKVYRQKGAVQHAKGLVKSKRALAAKYRGHHRPERMRIVTEASGFVF